MPTSLQISLLALSSRKSLLEPALCAVKRHISEDDTKWVLCNFILIQVAVFLEEWKAFSTHSRDREDVKETCRVAGPALARIHEWRGLTKFRNGVLVHARGRDKKSLPINDEIMLSRTPSNVFEQILLGELAVYAISAAIILHRNEQEAGLREYGDGFMLSGGGINSVEEFRGAVRNVREEMCRNAPQLEEKFGNFRPWPD
jgi:hypothetical protein